MGQGGVLYTELTASLYGKPDAPPIVTSFIGGLGGRDISAQEFYQMVTVTREAIASGYAPPPRLLYTAGELREVRKLQAIAAVERQETSPGQQPRETPHE
jgi:pyruvate ferredoxin oxidoreductase alpha subunit